MNKRYDCWSKTLIIRYQQVLGSRALTRQWKVENQRYQLVLVVSSTGNHSKNNNIKRDNGPKMTINLLTTPSPYSLSLSFSQSTVLQYCSVSSLSWFSRKEYRQLHHLPKEKIPFCIRKKQRDLKLHYPNLSNNALLKYHLHCCIDSLSKSIHTHLKTCLYL